MDETSMLFLYKLYFESTFCVVLFIDVVGCTVGCINNEWKTSRLFNSILLKVLASIGYSCENTVYSTRV
jgi:hypothetical protein